MKEKHSFKKMLQNNGYLFKICFEAAPLYLLMFIGEGIKNMTFIFFEHTYGIKYILETIEFNRPIYYAIRYLVILMIALAFGQIYSGILFQYLERRSKIKIIKKFRTIIFEKSKELDLECYDRPKFYNELVLSVAEAEKCVERLLVIVNEVVRSLTMVLICGTYFLMVDAGSALFILASFSLTVVFGQVMNYYKIKLRLEKNPLERQRAYVHRVFYLNEYAKELRMNPEIKERLYEDFDLSQEELYCIEKKYATKCWFLGFLEKCVANSFVGNSLYIIYLIYKAMVVHSISYSELVVLFNSSGNVKEGLKGLASALPKASENSIYIEKIKTFLAYKQKILSTNNLGMPQEPKRMELRNVSFAYDKAAGNIINHINMTIEPYEKIALVGYNGAGKTTLIKLLMRLYDVSEGEILLDNINIKAYNTEAYHNGIGVVFQDYKLFAATVEENVVMDNLMASEEEKVVHSLEKSGFSSRLSSLGKGLNTPLTTEFEKEGVNLSGGESQKIAIARVLYKDAHMIILDEPSSALDPISEYNLNKTMEEAAKHRTVIFISHRLSTTRDADKIYMLENGSIIEAGKHDELLNLKGKYAKMWETQAGRYA